MFIVSVTVWSRVPSFQFWDWLLGFFCFVASRFLMFRYHIRTGFFSGFGSSAFVHLRFTTEVL